jgi:hypothetical protein
MSAGRFQWVFLEDCGCAFGVLEDRSHSQAAAWQDFYDEGSTARTERAIGKAVARGVRVVRVDHPRYVAKFMPQMYGSYVCPHGGAS